MIRLPLSFRFRSGLQLALLPLAAQLAAAASYTWDNNSGTAPNPFDGASNTAGTSHWTTAGRWWDGAANQTWGAGPGAADTAVFGAGGALWTGIPGAVRVDNVTVNLGGLQFNPYTGNAAKYNITGGTTVASSILNFSSGSTINVSTNWVRPFAAINATIAGTGGLNVTGPGILEFGSATNTFTGGLNIGNGSTVATDSSLRLGAAADAVNFSGNSTLVLRANAVNVPRNLVFNAGATGTVDVLNGVTDTLGSATNTISGSGNFVKAGLGSLLLTGNNSTLSGSTGVRQGTLTLDFSNAGSPATNIISSSSAAKLFGGTLAATGKAATVNSQTFNGLTLDPGASSLSQTLNTATSLAMNFGGITRNTGSTLNVAAIAAGTSYGTTAANSNGILGGWGTVGGADWIANDGSNNFTAYSAYDTSTLPSGWLPASNVSLALGPSGTVTAPTTINSLKLTGPGSTGIDPGQTLTVSSGGILVTGGAQLISGGTLASGTDLIVHQYAVGSSTTILSDISASAITKSGAGQLTLGGNNSGVSGNTYLNAGTLEVSSDANLGAGSSVISRAGTTLRIAGSTAFTSAKNFKFDLGSDSYGASALGANSSGANFILDVTNTAGTTISGGINVTAGTFLKTGAGALTLTNSGSNTFGRLNGGLAFSINNGSVVLDGGPTSSWNVGQGELMLGDTSSNAVSMELKSGIWNNGSFAAVGRGTGTTGTLTPTLKVSGGTFNTGNLYTGFNGGNTSYWSRPAVEISGSGIVNVGDGLRIGESQGSFATLTMTGNSQLNINTQMQLGHQGSAVVSISGNSTVTLGNLRVGQGTLNGTVNAANTTASTGVAAVNQTGGTVQVNAGNINAGDHRIGGYQGGNDINVYGSYSLSGSTTSLNLGNNNFQIGAYGKGVMNISSGATVNVGNGYPVVGRFQSGVVLTNSNGVLNINNGTFSQTGTGQGFIVGEAGTGVATISGATGLLSVAGTAQGLSIGHTATGIGTLNIANGGTVQAPYIKEGNTAGSSDLYINGGIIKPTASSATFLQGLDNATVGPGGAIFDSNGANITVNQALKAPTGGGVTSVAFAASGAGYIGEPIVVFSGGGGAGATGTATISGGQVTGITITNPGRGYTSAPTVTLIGGYQTAGAGAGTLATGSVGFAANVATGGLTKKGGGTLTLGGVNTYGGNTVVEAGTLALSATGSIATSPIIEVKSGATFDVSAVSGFTLAAGQTLRGKGTVTGGVATATGSVIAPGESPGTLTFTSSVDISATVTASASGSLLWDLDDVNAPATNDLAVLTSGNVLTIGSGVLEIDDFAFAIGAGFGNGTYVLWDTDQPISGTLGSNVTSTISGRTATLAFANGTNDLVLTVVPEPSSAAAALAGLGLLMLRRRR